MLPFDLTIKSLAVVLGLSLTGCSDAGILRPGTLPRTQLPAIVAADGASARRGAAAYERHCKSCHGESGDGRGPSAALWVPRPRNFVSAIFHCRSTPSGSLPLPS